MASASAFQSRGSSRAHLARRWLRIPRRMLRCGRISVGEPNEVLREEAQLGWTSLQAAGGSRRCRERFFRRHCEERSDKAMQLSAFRDRDCVARPMTGTAEQSMARCGGAVDESSDALGSGAWEAPHSLRPLIEEGGTSRPNAAKACGEIVKV